MDADSGKMDRDWNRLSIVQISHHAHRYPSAVNSLIAFKK